MWFVHIVVYGILVAIKSLFKFLVASLSLCDAFDKSFNLLMSLVLPWVSLSPVVVEVFLYHSHLF